MLLKKNKGMDRQEGGLSPATHTPNGQEEASHRRAEMPFSISKNV